MRVLAFFFMAALGFVLAAGTTACGDDSCSLGESRCYGNETRVCSGPNDLESGNHFNTLGFNCGSTACYDIMDKGLRVAVCSTSGAKDSRCDTASGSICVDGITQLYCDRGYSAFEKQCAATCLTSSIRSKTFCALSDAKNPACAAGSGPRCDGSSVVTCQEGFATARSVCTGAGASCVQTSGGFHRAFCVSAATCTGKDDVHCDGAGAITGCYGGAVVAMTCDAGTECREYGTLSAGREAECVVR
ncbi:hypothetical protein BH09MYX1_BH09MYX1_10600 [soil metagenome]